MAPASTLTSPATARHGGISSFALKVIAIVGMTTNHACYIFYPYLPVEALFVLFGLGGVTFPVMVFLLVEGYRHTSNVRRYGLRLLAFALVSQVPYWLFLAHDGNVLFTLLLCLVALYLDDHLDNRALFWLTFAAILAASSFCDWGIMGPLMALIMKKLPGRCERIVYAVVLPAISTGVPYALAFLATFDLEQLAFALYGLGGNMLAIPLLLAYNGTRGRSMKWFFYAYYPAHILVLGLVKGLLLNDWTLGYAV